MSAGLAFLLMCVIWGTTWIAMAEGVRALPPLLFAGTRFMAAGLVLIAWQWARHGIVPLLAAEWRRLLLVAVLNITLCYAPLFWGMQTVDTGLAAVINLALTPVALYGFGLAYRQERLSGRALIALPLGALGLALLLGRGDADTAGVVAMVLGTLSYCWGSVLARPLLTAHGALPMAGLLMTIGGALLVLLGLLLEPLPTAAALAPRAVVAWAFLVLAGSLAAYTIYLRLLRDWGPLRAGLFAYVSPVLAVALGALVYGEAVSMTALAGMALMLGAAAAVPRG
jgi:drug/metabolite transporter (DMT)-like permease